MKRWKTILTAAAGMTAALLMTVPAFASVSKISISVEDVINTGEDLREPEITLNVSDCEIAEIDWSKDVSKWKAASKVTATLTLTTDDTFKSSYKSDSVRVQGGDFISASRVDDNTLKVRITYVPRAQLGVTEEAGWSSRSETTAVWKKVPFATAYQLRLYREGTLITILTSDSTSVDLAEYMTQEGYYYYEVRAVGETSAERYYLLSGEYVTSEDRELDDLGETGGSWKNYQDGVRYVRSDGSSPAGQWEKITGAWYYFDGSGYMLTGWQQIGGSWYYLGTDGRMLTGWQEIDGKDYYLQEDGRMFTGWLQGTPGIWYYLNPDGSMAVNTVIDGTYSINAYGQWIEPQ